MLATRFLVKPNLPTHRYISHSDGSDSFGSSVILDETRAGKILRFAQNDTCGVVILNEVKDLILKLSHYSSDT